jgi:hypothetical protein
MKGYRRPAASELQPADQPLPASPSPVAVDRPPHEIELPSSEMSEELARRLESATTLGLQKLEDILRLPTDQLNGNVLRAQTAAARDRDPGTTSRRREPSPDRREGDVMARLLKTIEEERKKLPREPRRKRITQTPATRAGADQVQVEA